MTKTNDVVELGGGRMQGPPDSGFLWTKVSQLSLSSKSGRSERPFALISGSQGGADGLSRAGVFCPAAAYPDPRENIESWQYTFFNQANGFLVAIRLIETIRKRLSPDTKTATNEVGVILPSDIDEMRTSKVLPTNIPQRYWNAAGALYRYLFRQEARLEIDVIGESQLFGYPSQFPSVSMMDWTNGKPNARFWVLELLMNNFHSGDRLVGTAVSPMSQIESQLFATPGAKSCWCSTEPMRRSM